MTRNHPCPRMAIPVSEDVYRQLTTAACRSGFEKEDWEIAADAIDEWTRRHNPDALSMPATSGYQWKGLFLPAGTLLRTVFKGKNYHCLVEGDQILYEGKAVSPSGFVNAVGGVRRNAWESTWILFPGTKIWKLANTLRPSDRPARARASASSDRHAPTPRASSPRAPTAPAPAAPQERPMPAVSPAPAPKPARHARGLDTHPAPSPSIRDWNRGTERRARAEDRIATLLQQQLLPLLWQICSPGMPSSAARSPASG